MGRVGFGDVGGGAPHDKGGIARRAREGKGGLEPEQVGVGHERARGVKYREEGGGHGVTECGDDGGGEWME
jgi:hypothetical protein